MTQQRLHIAVITIHTPHYENVPFEVAEGWGWTTVAEISKSILYGVSESAKTSGAYKLLRITDIQENNVDWNTVPFTDYDENKVGVYLLEENDILFARTGATVGKSYLVKGLCEPSIYASYLIRVQTFKEILPQYVKYFFESGFYWEQIERSSVGIGQPNVNGTTLGNLRLPIPPINEQEHIVSELKKWLAVITSIETNKNGLQGYIESAKSKILDLAIHGKLVPQDPEDEPAIELLRRINPKFTPCDNGQYGNIPNGWCECKLGEIANIIGGVSYDKNDVQSSGVRILRGGNIQDGYIIDCIDDVYIPSSYANKDNSIYKGDIVVVASTGSSTLIGKAAFSDDFLPNTQIGAFLRIVRTKDVAISEYIGQVFMSEYYRTYIRNLAKGSNINNIKNYYLTEFTILLPPLAEQSRIVTKIKELFRNIQSIMDCCS